MAKLLAKLIGFFRRSNPSSADSLVLDLSLPKSQVAAEPSKALIDDDITLTKWFADNGSCPDCGGRSFVQGLRGGASQNISCDNAACGARYNVLVINGQYLFAQRIEERTDRHLH
jgi:hypothetical protein